jgi:hypothetical protein
MLEGSVCANVAEFRHETARLGSPSNSMYGRKQGSAGERYVESVER